MARRIDMERLELGWKAPSFTMPCSAHHIALLAQTLSACMYTVLLREQS